MERVVTRKQHFINAQAAPLQAGKCIRTAEQLEALATLAKYNPKLADVVDTLNVILFSPFSAAALRQSIMSLPSLTDLILIVPSLRTSAVLRNVCLPKLDYFRTDLPHHTLIPFLQAHPSITSLDILDGAHAGAVCPLTTMDLSHVNTFAGPAYCISQLTHAGTEDLTIELEDDCHGASLSLRTISSPVSALYLLVLDIRDDDDGILNSIAAVFPNLRKLKLNEKPSVKHRRSLTRRAWNDTLAWSRALRKLPDLEELILRTHAPLVRKAGDMNLERKVILAWINGVRRVSVRVAPKPHPTLYRIGVWYGARKYDGGCVTQWTQLPGGWARTKCDFDPDRDYLFI